MKRKYKINIIFYRLRSKLIDFKNRNTIFTDKHYCKPYKKLDRLIIGYLNYLKSEQSAKESVEVTLYRHEFTPGVLELILVGTDKKAINVVSGYKTDLDETKMIVSLHRRKHNGR
jgi:hypothetical protein